MIVAHVSLTPLEGAAWAAAEAFREAGFDSFCIAPDAYDNGRQMPTDYRLPPVGGAVARLHRADVVFSHNALPCREGWYPEGKPTVGWFHDAEACREGHRLLDESRRPWGLSGLATDGAMPAAWPLPELLPLKHRFYQPREKPDGRVRVAYCLAGRRRTWRGEPTYEAVLAALGGLNADIDVIAGLSLADRLRRMAAAHVVVDGCIENSCGRASLEALALGCVPVNGCDAASAWNIQRMTGGCGHPFVVSDLGRLHRTLRRLIDLTPQMLVHMGRRNRQWLEAAWGPAELIERNVKPLIDAALTAAGAADATADVREPLHTTCTT